MSQSPRPNSPAHAADERFRALVEAAPDGLLMVNDAGTIVLVNRRIEELFGFRPEQLVGKPVEVLLPFDPRARHRSQLAGFVADPHRRMMGEGRDLSARRRDGSVFPVEISLSPVPTEDGILVAAAIRDVSARRRAASEIAGLATIVSSSHDAILSKTLDGTIRSWNPAAVKMYGYTAGEAIGRPVTMLLPDESDSQEVEDMLVRVRAGEAIDQFETQRRTKAGKLIDVELVVSPIRDVDGDIVGACTIAREVTERKHVEAQLQFLASHDPLTGLFNRRRFESELARVVDESARYSRPGALLIVDLDSFKEVNDRFGHAAGDTLVQVISDRMRETVRQTDVIARIGGDEFAIILQECATADALVIARAVLDVIGRHPVAVDDTHHAAVTASVGIRPFGPGRPTTPGELTVEADSAMYEAKAAGRNRCVLFNDSSSCDLDVCHVPWLDRLRHALDDHRFELFAQPIVALTGHQLPRYELLLRLRGKDGVLMTPDQFLHHAERVSLMGEIDRWVLQSAARLLHEHARAGNDLVLSVNLSGKTMNDLALSADLADILAAFPIRPGRLVAEVTETAAIVNMQRACDLAREVRDLGCEFALDDFGAGFASFYYLKHLDFDYLKIDGEFIKSLTQNPTDQLVVKAIVDLARGLGTETIAEFVGDDATVALLRDLGVDYGQGYHLGRPRPLAEVLPPLPASVLQSL